MRLPDGATAQTRADLVFFEDHLNKSPDGKEAFMRTRLTAEEAYGKLRFTDSTTIVRKVFEQVGRPITPSDANLIAWYAFTQKFETTNIKHQTDHWMQENRRQIDEYNAREDAASAQQRQQMYKNGRRPDRGGGIGGLTDDPSTDTWQPTTDHRAQADVPPEVAAYPWSFDCRRFKFNHIKNGQTFWAATADSSFCYWVLSKKDHEVRSEELRMFRQWLLDRGFPRERAYARPHDSRRRHGDQR